MEEKERFIKRFENCIEDDVRHITYCVNDRISICDLLNQQDKRIKELESKHLLNESEYQNYCSFKIIEPEIRGCLDREKVLEKENQQLKQQLEDKNNTIQELLETQLMLESSCSYQVFLDCQDEIEKLKQQLHDLPKKIVEEIRKQIIKDVNAVPDYHDEYDLRLSTRDKCIECLDTILKKYGGKNG